MFDPAHRNEMELARTRAGIVNHITDCGQGSVFAPALEVYAPQRNLIGSMCCARRVRPDLDLHRYAQRHYNEAAVARETNVGEQPLYAAQSRRADLNGAVAVTSAFPRNRTVAALPCRYC